MAVLYRVCEIFFPGIRNRDEDRIPISLDHQILRFRTIKLLNLDLVSDIEVVAKVCQQSTDDYAHIME